jgi:hypothetical protein
MKVIDFPSAKVKAKIEQQKLEEVIDTDLAVDYVIAGMIQEVAVAWVLNHWTFKELDVVVDEMRDLLKSKAPEVITRGELTSLMANLRGSWLSLAESIRKPD